MGSNAIAGLSNISGGPTAPNVTLQIPTTGLLQSGSQPSIIVNSPFAPASPAAVASLSAQMAAMFKAAFDPRNTSAIAAYNKAVVVAAALNDPAPTPPMLTVVNYDLIQQYEAQANAGGQPTWAGILMDIQYVPPPPPPVAASLELGAQLAPGIWKLIVNSGAGPSDAQPFSLNGVNYIAHWAGPFGPVYAQQTQ